MTRFYKGGCLQCGAEDVNDDFLCSSCQGDLDDEIEYYYDLAGNPVISDDGVAQAALSP
ncbi:MAG: hypothetical protein HY764_00455 [Candidatus Portnoybacteria bacterium]|nr:hypothetical protein [Candidatus Portnoybacteria bacterium]